ncbi:HofP DNA utilization family protein [Erwinia billingiae]|uniref:HofP DNA utilization family protein n=1 Tax=Erwinia billingiae TaxID=182337 RepID=UPI002246615E|nr:HofP DNA utilization family protein [Erwinia billingiae]MCX0498730.1 DUF2531 family protein [Erwinia billingiae]
MKTERGNLCRAIVSLLLLIAADSQAGRDPFQPLVSECEQHPMPFHWQLKGIIGQADDFHAWLIAKQGKWIQLTQGQQLSQRWQLQEITALSITLADLNGCEPAFKRNLKGSIYEKDSLPADVDADGRTDAVKGQ